MKFKLTDLGKIMEAQLIAGSKPVITRIEASDAFSSNEGALLSVQNKKQDLEIEGIAVIEGASHLKFVLHNVGLEEEYLLRQVGIYARQNEDAEEILYMIGQDKSGERVPAANEKLVEYEYDLVIHTENTYEAQVVVKGSYFATKKEIEELEKQKVSASGGDVSGTVSSIQEPEKPEDKYPEPMEKWKVGEIFGGLYRWARSLKEDKVDTVGGNIADTQVLEFSAETEQFPVPVPKEAPKTLWGKMKKFVEDFRAWYTGVCLIGHIVNNCTSGATNLPLAAKQGQVLMELYTKLNSDLSASNTNLSTHKYSGDHDGRYYTEEEANSLLYNKLSKDQPIQSLSLTSFGTPALIVNGVAQLIPLTYGVDKQFITTIGMRWSSTCNKWQLAIKFVYDNIEREAYINVDQS